MAIYTLNTPTDQNQDIAYSSDGGYTFTKVGIRIILV